MSVDVWVLSRGDGDGRRDGSRSSNSSVGKTRSLLTRVSRAIRTLLVHTRVGWGRFLANVHATNVLFKIGGLRHKGEARVGWI